MPIVLGVGAALALVAFAATRSPIVVQQPAPAAAAPTPSPAAVGAPSPSTSTRGERPTTERIAADPGDPRDRYVTGRSRELLEESLRGLPSSAVSDEFLERTRAVCAAEAEREWGGLCSLLAAAERIGAQAGDVALYRAAADRVWPIVRDTSRAGVVVKIDELLTAAADQERLQRRIDGR